MPSSSPLRRHGTAVPLYAASHTTRPPTVNAYDDSADVHAEGSSVRLRQQPSQQPLRRRGAPVPAPPSLLSTKSSTEAALSARRSTSSHHACATPGSNSSPRSSGGTAATSPPSHVRRPESSSAHRSTEEATSSRRSAQTASSQAPPPPASASASTTTTPSSLMIPTPFSAAAYERTRPRRASSASAMKETTSETSPSRKKREMPDVTSTRPGTTVSTPLHPLTSNHVASIKPRKENKTAAVSPTRGDAPQRLSRRARAHTSRSPTPEDARRAHGQSGPTVPSLRGPGAAERTDASPQRPPPLASVKASPSIIAQNGPTVVRASTPRATAAAVTPSSSRSVHEGERGSTGTRRGGAASSGSTRTPSMHASMTHPSPSATTPPSPPASPADNRVVTAAATTMSNAEREKAERDARKQLRTSLYNGHIKVHGYVAQTAYAQKNPFRRQDFASFSANPKYQPPADFDIYSQALATRVYGLEVSRASQGEFMMQRLVDAAHPASPEERAEVEALLSSTLEKMQVGDWFYKWTRINHVHQRYVWLNLQRGTLMWSLSPKESVVLNSELKLSTVKSITPDCLQLEAPMRVFYRMTINTPDRCISLATEIRKKFDVWYRVLLQLTAPNLVYGVPGVWGRPSSSVDATGRGADSRWAMRFSPLDAVMNEAPGHVHVTELNATGMVSSSD